MSLNRRDFMKTVGVSTAGALTAASLHGRFAQANNGEQPNILWITVEDVGLTLGAYGDEYATTPNLDRFAEESVRYTQAYVEAPVCSPARSTLITGNYAVSLGTHHMRSVFPIPEYMTGFPSKLREAGYYTSNNVKTDYNTANEPAIIEASWDENSETGHWRNRPDSETAFFSVFNLMEPHQSRTMVWPYEQFVEEVQSRLSPDEIHDPDEVPVPPYYPDTPLVRRELARYYDCVTAMDKRVGEFLEQLEEDGLAEDTIVFFFSDHGAGRPRHKRATLDTGLRIPMLVRFPEKYRHLAPADPGETTDRMVSFVDFGPAVLSLAGIQPPEFMQGRPFLGEYETAPRERLYHFRDRVDETRDCVRAVRDEQYLYVRNYMPHLSYHQYAAWADQGELRHEFYRLDDLEGLSEPLRHYVSPTRPAEELYAYREDPLNLENLAGSEEHQDALERMRQILREEIRERRDLGFIPESEAWEVFDEAIPWEAVRNEAPVDLEALYEAAEKVGIASESELLEGLDSDNPGVRYWSAIGLTARESISEEALDRLSEGLDDPSAAARIEIANAVARHGEVSAALSVLIEALDDPSLDVTLHAARTIELLEEEARDAIPAMQTALEEAEEIRPPETEGVIPGDPDLAWFIQMSANGFLSRVGD